MSPFENYQISIANDVNWARVEKLEIVKEKDEVLCAHPSGIEGEEIGAEGCFEVMYGGNGVCTEPGLDMGQWRDTLDFHAHGRSESGSRGE